MEQVFSLASLVQPSAVNLFGETEPAFFSLSDELFLEEGKTWELGEGVNVTQTQDAAELVISGFGIFLSKKSERLLVKKGWRALGVLFICWGKMRRLRLSWTLKLRIKL